MDENDNFLLFNFYFFIFLLTRFRSYLLTP